MIEFTPQELSAIRMTIADSAVKQGEDIIGVLMKSGAFHHLPEGGIASLAEKLRPSHQEMYPYRYAEGWKARFYQIKYAEYKNSGGTQPYEDWLDSVGRHLDVRYLSDTEKKEIS